VATGTYTYWAQVWLGNEAISEWSPPQSFVVQDLTPTPSALVVYAWPVERVSRGTLARFELQVQNTSVGALPQSAAVWLYADGPGWVGSHWMTSTSASSLLSASTRTFTINWPVSGDLIPGQSYTYSFQVWADTGPISGLSLPATFIVQ
jgi:hypothetical protein